MKQSKKKQLPLLEGITISDIGSEGQAVARHNDLVIFVKGAVPGDVCNIQLTRKKNKYAEGFIAAVIKKSDKQTEPFCNHFGVCGGCKWQNLDYTWQLFYKQKQVEDALKRIAKVPFQEILPIIASDKTTYYRNKLEFTFSNKKWLNKDDFNKAIEIKNASIEINTKAFADSAGNSNALGFHIPGLFDKVVDIEKCWLQGDFSNEIRNEIRNFCLRNNYTFFDLKAQHGLMRNLVVRTSSTGELMVIVIFHEKDNEKIESLMQHLSDQFPQITSLLYILNTKRNDTFSDLEVLTYKGKDHINENMEGLTFKIGPKSFYQTNAKQAAVLYTLAKKYANLKGNEVVYDLYTGTGTIANFVASDANKVIGVEYVADAIEDAKINSTVNNISNTAFFAGDMKDVLNDEFISKHGKPDVIITDPPRAGMHIDVVNKLIEIKAQTIVYVSCNPSTQARDIALMAHLYDVAVVQPVDMFPHTHHVECVIKLELKK
ncbi:MAG TPA: 23S rRNA (uracil(1939)-C(5))-methyltransferase RlmD [Bacteroidia bacterium]|nr:23S rRNA (uracil(1939)-C(5))-methyltransferase RlmD [Bacteroidia bacterium]